MKADITEFIGKTNQMFGIIVLSEKEEILLNIHLKGKGIWEQLDQAIEENTDLLTQVTRIKLFNKHYPPLYLNKFTNLQKLYITGSGKLAFPDLNSLKTLSEISINQQSKAPELTNLRTATNLNKLEIGVFPPLNPVKINSIEDITSCDSISELTFGNVKLMNDDFRALSRMKNLRKLSLPQNIDVDTLAYLSVKLHKTESEELKPWQKLAMLYGENDIKINGKRRPFLSTKNDKEKIQKYEDQFSKLQMKYAV